MKTRQIVETVRTADTDARTRKFMVLLAMSVSLIPAIYFASKDWFDGVFPSWDIILTETLKYVLISTVFSGIITLIIIYQVALIESKFSWEKHPILRVLSESVLTLLTTVSLTYILLEITVLIFPALSKSSAGIEISDVLTVAIMMNLMLLPLLEGFMFFNGWSKANLEQEKLLLVTEKMEKQQLLSQFESLKNQINPHFLFNSLTVLSSLIHENKEKAETFINEFASVYRYVLDVADKQVISLHKEMKFIQSYLFLQKIRFGKNLDIQMNLDAIDNYKILPLSVQLVIENALKHNTVSTQSPLTIIVEIKNSTIIIKNNIQLRDEPIDSTGIGINNIKERYRLYNNSEPTFEIYDNTFIATIPLI